LATSPAWQCFWALWSIGFGLFSWFALPSPWKYVLLGSDLFFAGALLFLWGWNTLGPGRSTRQWFKEHGW
jgi:CHASE2 domain-containing sensor protein